MAGHAAKCQGSAHLTRIEIPQKSGIQGLALAPDGRQVAVAVRDQPEIMLWDIDSGTRQTAIRGHNLVILALAYSHDGTRLPSSTIGSEPMKLWDTRIWEAVGRLETQPGMFLFRPGFLSDGATIVTAEATLANAVTTARLWQAPSWEAIAKAESEGIWK